MNKSGLRGIYRAGDHVRRLVLVFWAVPVMAFSQATSQPSQGEQGTPPVTIEVDPQTQRVRATAMGASEMRAQDMRKEVSEVEARPMNKPFEPSLK